MLDHTLPVPRHIWRDRVRIIGAVAAKDLSESVRNKTGISFILTAIFLLVMYRLLPVIGAEAVPVVHIVEPAGSAALTLAFEQSDEVFAFTHDSYEVMVNRLRHSDVPELGLVLEAGLAEQTPPDVPLPLTGYVMYWVGEEDAAALVDEVSTIAAAQLGRPVAITLAEERVYADTGGSGPSLLLGLSEAVVVLFIGVGLVPALMLEEKKEGTLDALLTSPATATTVTLGKALAGLVFCLAAGLFALVLYRNTIIQWPVVLLAILGWSLFSVALGLLVGTVATARQQLQVFLMTIIPVFAIPVFLILMPQLLPDWLGPLLQFLPSVSLAELLILSGTPNLTLEIVAPRLALIWGVALATLVAVAIAVRRRSA